MQVTFKRQRKVQNVLSVYGVSKSSQQMNLFRRWLQIVSVKDSVFYQMFVGV